MADIQKQQKHDKVFNANQWLSADDNHVYMNNGSKFKRIVLPSAADIHKNGMPELPTEGEGFKEV
ncbi:MAG: hypothetical protein AB8B41_09205 [Prochlorococcus sp.]|jgi:hypothetical protein